MEKFESKNLGNSGSKENNEPQGERQEEEINEGLGILVKKKSLYHGSGTSGIEKFNKAEEDTVGSGIYFTSEAKDAVGYAQRRSRGREDASPVIYEASVENMKLLDLRKTENVKKVLEGFKSIVQKKLEVPNLNWIQEGKLREVLDVINGGNVGGGNLREVASGLGGAFTEYVKSLGYEGLITLEGGEGEDIGNHDTYLVFDPEKAKINQEQQIL